MSLTRAEERRRAVIRGALEAAEQVTDRIQSNCYLGDGMVLHFEGKLPWVSLPDGRRAHLHPIPRTRIIRGRGLDKGGVPHSITTRRMVFTKSRNGGSKNGCKG